jgi:hypothetical protein
VGFNRSGSFRAIKMQNKKGSGKRHLSKEFGISNFFKDFIFVLCGYFPHQTHSFLKFAVDGGFQSVIALRISVETMKEQNKEVI